MKTIKIRKLEILYRIIQSFQSVSNKEMAKEMPTEKVLCKYVGSHEDPMPPLGQCQENNDGWLRIKEQRKLTKTVPKSMQNKWLFAKSKYFCAKTTMLKNL